MAKGKSINGNHDGDNGANDTYVVTGRGTVDRDVLVQEIKDGQHPDTHVINVNGEEYARNNPNNDVPDNIND